MAEYGHPADVHERVARLWSGFLGIEVSVKDVSLLMTLFKMGREVTQQGEDNLVDMHGYLLVYERILDKEGHDVVIPTTEGA